MTVEDEAGNTSDPASVRIYVDVTLPVIELVGLSADVITNEPLLSVRGSVNEPADVMLNGNELPLEADNSFEGVVPLVEGLNNVTVFATDRAGNSATELRAVTLDTVPPTLPPAPAILIEEVSEERVRVSAAATSVEAGVQVTVTNLRIGESVQVFAEANGAFAVEIGATPGDPLSIQLTDAATNTSGILDINVPNDVPLLEIISPVEGAYIEGDRIDVYGQLNLDGKLNVGITVNDQPGLLAHDGEFAVNDVPLVAGDNELHIVVHTLDGTLGEKTIVVGANGEPLPFRLSRNSARSDTAPVTVYINYDYSGDTTSESVQLFEDRDGDGDWERSRHWFESGTHGVDYDESGLHRLLAMTQTSSTQYQDTHFTLIRDPAHMDLIAAAVWQGMRERVVEADIEGALAYFDEFERERYATILQLLDEDAAAALEANEAPVRAIVSGRWAEYLILKGSGAEQPGYVMRMQQDATGVWRIEAL